MRTTKVLSVSLPEALYQQAQQLAQEENRTMSEFIREAIRTYQRERRERMWGRAQAHMESVAEATGVRSEEDVVRLVKEFRRERAANAEEAQALLTGTNG